MHSLQFIFNELIKVNSAIEEQIIHVKNEARRHDIDPYDLQDSSGNFMLAPLLVAKANALNGMAMIRRGGNS